MLAKDDVIEHIGRVCDAAERHQGRLYSSSLRNELAELFKEEVPDDAPEDLSDERREHLEELILLMTSLLARCEWSPSELKVAIGCRSSAADLYNVVPLDRCLEMLRLLAAVTQETKGAPDRDRASVYVAVAAFRAAQGDSNSAHDFWEQPLAEGSKSAKQLVAEVRDADALLVVAGHGKRTHTVNVCNDVKESFINEFRANIAS